MRILLRFLLVASWGLLPSLAFGASSAAVEYYHSGYGHYFVTASPQEVEALDTGRVSGWIRTGESFDVLELDAVGSANVCRYWSVQPFAGGGVRTSTLPSPRNA